MERIILIVLMLSGVLQAFADLNTKNNYTGTWTDAGSWNTAQPSPLTTNIANQENITIRGYITRNGNLSFANLGSNSHVLLIEDTLVVDGDMSFANNSINLEIGPNGVLVVFGHFTAENKVVLDNGGTMVVTNGMSLQGGQQDYSGTGGLYVDGPIVGNGDVADAGNVDQPTSSLNGGSTGQQALYNFISGGGTTPLPIKLGSFDLKLISNGVKLNWETMSEENFSHFEVQRSLDGIVFEIIAEVQSSGGLSASANYSYYDYHIVHSTLYYRLNAVDLDGSSEMFETKSITVAGDDQLQLMIFPNPLLGQKLTLLFSSDNVSHQIGIYNIQGEMLYEQYTDNSRLEIQNLNLQPGVYLVKLESNGAKAQQKLLVR